VDVVRGARRFATKARKLDDSVLAPPGHPGSGGCCGQGRGRGWSDTPAKDVFEEEPEPGRRLLFREDVLHQCEDLGDCVQIEHFGEVLDVLCVAGRAASAGRTHASAGPLSY
jgi:hypothetical protein